MSELKPCPCGETPKDLHVSAMGNNPKWAYVSGSCCNEWGIEFRNQWKTLGESESIALATCVWNETKRVSPERSSEIEGDRPPEKGTLEYYKDAYYTMKASKAHWMEAANKYKSKLSNPLNTQLAALQARIDALILEYEPEEMTQEQKDNWATHQKPTKET